MPQTIAKVGYEVQLYPNDEKNGTTASRSDSSDGSSLSTLVGSEIGNMVDHIDIEKAGAEVLGTQSSAGRSRARLLLWMALNTLASISIVRSNTLSHFKPLQTKTYVPVGLCKQGHLRRPILPPLPSRLRRIPPIRDGPNTLCPLPPGPRHVCSSPNRHEIDAPAGRGHVPERRFAEPVLDIFVDYVFPNSTGFAYSNRCRNQLPLLPQIHSPSCSVDLAAYVFGRGAHLILRAESICWLHSRIDKLPQRRARACKCFGWVSLYGVDWVLSETIRGRWVSAPLQSGAYGWYFSPDDHAMDGHTAGIGRGAR